jgi:Domain of unknown function (DUF3291)
VTRPAYQLAQLNIGRLTAPLTDPATADFVANLDPINALAERSPGFVWRFQTEEGNATAVRPYDDDRIAINFSVWEDVESLRNFVYRGDHATIMKRRREWFDKLDELYMVLWWVPTGHRPTVQEAVARLEHLKQHGPSPEAFTFRELYPAPDASSVDVARGFDDTCPAWT